MNRPVPGSKPEDLGAPTNPLLTEALFSYVIFCVVHYGLKTVLIRLSLTRHPIYWIAFPRIAFPRIARILGFETKEPRYESAVATASFQGATGVAVFAAGVSALFRREFAFVDAVAAASGSHQHLSTDAARAAAIGDDRCCCSYCELRAQVQAAVMSCAAYDRDWSQCHLRT